MAERVVARLDEIPQGGMRPVEIDRLLGMRADHDQPAAKAELTQARCCHGRCCPVADQHRDASLGRVSSRQCRRRQSGRIDQHLPVGDTSRISRQRLHRRRLDQSAVGYLESAAMPRADQPAVANGAFVQWRPGMRALTSEGVHHAVQPDQDDFGPVDRTLLSKQALAGQSKLDALPLWDAEQRKRLDVERVVAEVTALDAAAKRVECSDGTKIGYDVALVATGGRPRRLDVPGGHLRGVFTLRHRADVAAILEATEGGASAVVIGTSFIGMEAAGALSQKGVKVTVVGPEELPFAKQFGPDLAGALRGLHERNGVQFRLGTSVTRIEGDDSVQAVILRTGERLATGIVLTGIGVQPATEFVANVSKAEDGGILVDPHLRAADGLYAAGDVAAFTGPDGKRLRIEHWRVAEQQGRTAARNMLGHNEAYTRVPFFWTAQHDVVVDYVGHATEWDEIVVDGDIGSFDFLAFYVRDGMVAAVATTGRDHETALLSELMRERLTLSAVRERLRR